jgi:DegV family protein with EDD domain
MLTIFTDTDTDITLQEAQQYGIKLISMPYIIDEVEVKPYEDFTEFNYHEFYDLLRGGVLPKTCAINTEVYRYYFEEELKKGNDILYIHFSRNMSGSFNAMDLTISELKEEYPNQTIYTIDTRGITILSNIIVKDILDLFKNGSSLTEVIAWSNENIDKYATYFFSDTLKFFARSGRVSNFTGFMGDLIGIKPIIYMDEKGTMTNIGKEKGKKKAIKKLVDYFQALALDPLSHRIIIGHTDALHLANKLGDKLQEKYSNKLNIEYAVVNPTAGSHCGPDTVGICFYAKHK